MKGNTVKRKDALMGLLMLLTACAQRALPGTPLPALRARTSPRFTFDSATRTGTGYRSNGTPLFDGHYFNAHGIGMLQIVTAGSAYTFTQPELNAGPVHFMGRTITTIPNGAILWNATQTVKLAKITYTETGQFVWTDYIHNQTGGLLYPFPKTNITAGCAEAYLQMAAAVCTAVVAAFTEVIPIVDFFTDALAAFSLAAAGVAIEMNCQ